MAYFPNNPNGQATNANSAPVVVSSDQSPARLAQDDTLVILARILKLLESLSITDSAQRQRITLDAVTGGLALGSVTITGALPAGGNTIGTVNVGSISSITTVTTVGAVTSITNALPTGANTIGNVTTSTIAGMDREMYINQARVAYNTGISAKLN